MKNQNEKLTVFCYYKKQFKAKQGTGQVAGS